jgi:FG-GAP-like repeat/FG-GAP repeat
MRSFFVACLVLSFTAPLLLSQSNAPVTSTPGAATVLRANVIDPPAVLVKPSPSGGLQRLRGHVPWISPESAAQSARGITSSESLFTSVHRGSGDPLFLSASTFNSGGVDATSIAAGDVNRDGIPDLVVANECGSGTCTTGVVEVFLGKGDGTFGSPMSFGSGGLRPSSVSIADLNGDGLPDLVVTNACADSSCTGGAVSVLLGKGNGAFNTPVSYDSGGLSASSVAIGDLNGDGKPDLAVANDCNVAYDCTSGSVGILFGNGNGTFSLNAVYGSGGQDASAIALADVNRDGKPDLVVATACSSENCTSGTVSVLLNGGNGAFQPAVSYNTGQQQADSVAVADVNGDGRLDLIVGNECGNQNCVSGSVSVLLGVGNGTFQAAMSYDSGGTGTVSVTVADLDGRSNPDVVVVNQCDSDADCLNGTVGVLAGNGDGTFRAALSYSSAAFEANSIAIADVNMDGTPDLLVTNACYENGCAAGAVSMLLGRGNDTFKAALNYESGGQDANAIAAGDLNRDGRLDLVVVSACLSEPGCASGAVGVLLGGRHGEFSKAVTYGSGGLNPHSVAIADVNDDGRPDLVVANVYANSSATTGSIGVLLGNGDGTFRPAMSFDSGAVSAVSVKIADLNGDGIPDLAVVNECSSTNCTSGTVSVLLGKGNGMFRPAVNYASGGQYASSVAVADVNRDGKSDLVVSNWCVSSGDCTSGSVSVLLGNGNGTFQPAVTYGTGGQFSSPVVVADLNRDGKLDLVVANEGSLGVLMGNGDGTFRIATVTATPTELDSGDGSLAIGDFNGDGWLDVASGAAGVLLPGNGDGTFQPPVSLGAEGKGLVAGDFDRNGKLDLADTGVTVLRTLP